MTKKNLQFHLVSAAVLVMAAFLVTGCGGGGDPVFDTVEDEGPADTGVDKSQKITFINPDPASRQVVSGVVAAEFTYEDALGLPASITVSFVNQSGFTPVVIEAPKPGTYSVNMDTTLVPDGNRSIQVVALSSDERSISAKGKVLVDNDKPLVSILEPTPADGSNFLGNLSLRVKVEDYGTRVRSVKITAGDFEWTWPEEAGVTAEVVDTRTTEVVDGSDVVKDLVIPTLGWQGGEVTLSVTAEDGVAEHKVTKNQILTFVESPGFVGGENLPLPDDSVGTMIAGIRTGPADDGIWGVVVSETNSLSLYSRSAESILTKLADVTLESCPKFVVADMDRDGFDDIVAFCSSAELRRVAIFRQESDLVFTELVSVPLESDVFNMTTGILNSDDFPDVAFVTMDETWSTGIILSKTDQFGDLDTWGSASLYSGAIDPAYVTIGQFGSDNRNAVVVGNSTNAQLTIFPVNQEGLATTGENSTLDPDDQLVKGVTSLAAVNLTSSVAAPNLLLYTDSADEETLGAATLNPSSFRVEKSDFWTAGMDPSDLVVGDIDGNNVPDVAVLCAGANMVQVFFGNIQEGGVRYFRDNGLPLLAGAARDVALADLDGEGHLDLVLLNREGRALTAILWESTEQGNRFKGSYQAILLPSVPYSVQLGHFTQPLAGRGANFLDAAVLQAAVGGGPAPILVFSADPVTGMPILPAGLTSVELNAPRKLVAGNLDVRLNQAGADPYKRPDDLFVTSDDQASTGDEPTAYALLFHEVTHTSVSASPVELPFGNKPYILTTADVDRDSSGDDYKRNDAIFVSRLEPESGDGLWILQTRLGQADGSFIPETVYGDPIPVMEMEDERNPIAIASFPMHRTLALYTRGTPGLVDVMVANAGTGDLTVFVNKGLAMLTPKDEGSRDFALGGSPVDIAPGYLRSKVDGTANPSDASDQYPDIVALLADKLTILYSLDKTRIDALGDVVGYEPPAPLAYPGSSATDLAVTDMNGDGYMDIAVLDQAGSQVWIYVNLGDRKFSAPFAFDTGTFPVEMVVADVDDDGCMDIVTVDQNGKTLTSLRNMTNTCRR